MAYHLNWRTDLENFSSYADKCKIPQNWTKITAKEFFNSFYNTPIRWTYETTFYEDSNGNNLEYLINAILFFIDWENQHGIGIARIWKKSIATNELKSKIQYFKFAICFHDWKELGPEQAKKIGLVHLGMFDHIYVCEKCGKRKREDSSG